MNILFVVPYVPNLVRVRPFNLISALADRGHRVTVLTLWTDESERRDVERLATICHEVLAMPMPRWRSLLNCLRAVPAGVPFQSVFSWRQDLVQALGEAVDEFDVVHVEHLRGSRYALYFKQHTGLPVVWDSVDCISHLFEQASTISRSRLGRWRSRLELDRTRRYEGWLVHQFDRALITSPTDKQALLRLNGRDQELPALEVLANGVDLDYFVPDHGARREAATLVMSGKMSYHANVTMALHLVNDIMPLVWAQRPEVGVWIVGKDPPREVLALAQTGRITVTGTVPDLRPYLQQASIAVSPLTYGAGIQNKVLEAMACATPVITTSQATAALPLVRDRDLVVADLPEAFAGAIVTLLDDPPKQRQLGLAGREYVENHHDWTLVAARLEAIYQEVARRKVTPQAVSSLS